MNTLDCCSHASSIPGCNFLYPGLTGFLPVSSGLVQGGDFKQMGRGTVILYNGEHNAHTSML